MERERARIHVTCTLAILSALAVALTFVPVSMVCADGGQDSTTAKAAYKSKCVLCHGPDGGGSATGKTMKVRDLRSPEVQKQSDAELAQVISNGKGAMPSFKNSLKEDQIQGLVKYIRSMAPKK